MEVDHQCANVEYSMQGILSEVANICQPYVEKLYSPDKMVILEGLIQIKNFVIGNNKQKSNFIVFGVVQRLKYLIQQEESDTALKTHCAVILGSLAKGIDADVADLLGHEILDVMFIGLRQSDLKLYEACIRCIRTIVTLPEKQALIFHDTSILPIVLESINRSMCIQECTCEVLTNCCKTNHQQDLLNSMNALEHVSSLFVSPIARVKAKALKAVSVMCYRNVNVCQNLLKVKLQGTPIVDLLIAMLSRGEPVQVQINAAKCFTYLYRSGAQGLDKNVVFKKVLPCLVRMCDCSQNIDERVSGAVTLSYLIESEPELQRISLICEQFPQKLASYFCNPAAGDTNNAADMKRFKYELSRTDDMRKAVLLAYAALLSNDEDMRDLVTTEALVRNIVHSLENAVEEVRVAALQCLLSLSRSVQILRTFFEDQEVWRGVIKVLQREDDKVASERELVVGSALLCNLLLDFSPCKWKLIDAKVLSMMKEWCRNETNVNLKRNGIWGFLNVTFQASEELKLRVLDLLDQDTLYMLAMNTDYEIIIKTLGVLNNLLATTVHVDKLMALHGDTIMQACMVAIESTSATTSSHLNLQEPIVPERIHMHALCVLGCVASGDEVETVQKYLVENENLMTKIIEYLGHTNEELQKAATECVWKICCGSASTVAERRTKLKEMGVIEVLQQLMINARVGFLEKIKQILAFLQA